MNIPTSVAGKIALQLSETIKQNINLMNTEGVIIASSDPNRVGQLHAGAKKLIDEGLPELVVESDTSFQGAKSGVNLPIYLDDELVGTIGITGPVDKVLPYGQIIKRMTEILLLDAKSHEQTIIEQKARDRFYDEWIIEELEKKNESEFLRLSSSFGVNPYGEVRIFVISFRAVPALSDEHMTDISRHVRNYLKKNLDGNAFRTATQMVCIVDASKGNDLTKVISEMFSYIKNTYHCECFAGIDEKPAAFSLHENYLNASKALDAAIYQNNSVVVYDPLDISFMLGNVPVEACKNYIHKLFPECTADEIDDYINFVEDYLELNGSLIALSEKLFIHKNTVKYKINKLTEMTGTDIRTCHGSYVFTLAVNLYKRAYKKAV